MSYQIGIIGGDGIGPEVVAEAMKCVDAAGVAYDAVPFDLGGHRYLRDGVVLEQEHLDAIRRPRRGDARRGRHARGAAGRDRAGPAPHPALRARPLRQPAPVRRRSESLQRRRRHGRHPREHRGHLRGRGWLPPQGHAARGRDPGLGEHPARGRAGHPVRVRAGAVAAQAPHAGPQDQRAHSSPATSGSARSTPSPPSSPTSPPRTTTSTPRASTSSRTRAATT